ncbi:hypothetical protein [Cysteiniphilum halobium]|uniref:hypothetical protein n=1 Tax=Cysteiniphilum halobium TaxID=2219059 RepID=UPI000E64AC8D|nr:hypothetical protein [Cysteiniphilum halobium]
MSNKNQTKPKMSMGKKALIGIGGALAVVLILSYIGSTSGGGSNNGSYQGGDLNAYNAKAGVGIKQLAANYKIASKQLTALQAQLLQMQQSLKKAKEDNGNNTSGANSQKLESLAQQNSSLNDQMQALQSQLAQLKATGRIQDSTNQNNQTGSYPVNAEDNSNNDNTAHLATTTSSPHVLSNVPDLALVSISNDSNTKSSHRTNNDNSSDRNNPLAKNTVGSYNNGTSDSKSAKDAKNAKNKGIPYYRIPEGATVPDVKLMTSIQAEVPVNGQLVEQPFSFKAVIGRKAILASRGVTLPPDLRGIIVEGYTWGNAQLSCARGYVTGMLFNWADGTYTYVGKSMTSNKRFDFNDDVLATLSTANGDVCIHGTVVNNPAPVITNLALMGALSKGGDAVSSASQSQLVNGAGTIEITKNLASSIAGGLVSGGASQTNDWYKSRIGHIYDIVYIPAAKGKKIATVSLLINKDIVINKDTTQRIIYPHNINSGVISHALD